MSERDARHVHNDGRSPSRSLSDCSSNGDRKSGIGISYRSRSKDRSRSRSPSVHKSKRKYSRSKSRSRSRDRSSYRRRSKYRSRSKSSRRYRHGSRSYSRSPVYSSQQYRRGRGRTHSRSPMSNRRRHTGNRRVLQDNPKPNRCLGVFGLNISTTEKQIYDIFSIFGPVDKVQIIIDAKTKHSRGFCFVYFENSENARIAKEECSGMILDGKEIRVDYSMTDRAHTPTPGIYMGKPTFSERRHGRDRDRDWGDGSYRSSRGSLRYRSPSPHYYSTRSRRKNDRSRSRSYSPYY